MVFPSSGSHVIFSMSSLGGEQVSKFFSRRFKNLCTVFGVPSTTTCTLLVLRGLCYGAEADSARLTKLEPRSAYPEREA